MAKDLVPHPPHGRKRAFHCVPIYDHISDQFMASGRYDILLTSAALGHIRALGRKHRSLVLETLRGQLALDPFSETRNRKPLSLPAPFGAHWELRFGPQNRFRVFYTLETDRDAVLVVAVGTKVRDRLVIAGKEI